eukprot:GCRY01002509.1.p1 GENE.GCRY01002509.1~~GCRY01002509.1.p1  ORF type:complete len:332 (+),score=54.82 GCRY01002509.1:297-1292(+)
MKGLVFENGNINLNPNLPIPQPSQTEVLVKVLLCGVCSTDLEIIKGYMGYQGILGHEFVGIVEKGPEHLIGQRIVGEINCSCWNCEYCKNNLNTHCPNRTTLGIDRHSGCFAEYICIPIRNVHVLPDSIPNDEAVFVEPLAAAFQILEQITVTSAQRVFVLGDGRLGQLCSRVLRTVLPPEQLTLIGHSEPKLSLAAAQGIHTCLESAFKQTAVADLVVDATGCAQGFLAALRLLKPRGILALKSTFVPSAQHPVDLSPVVINEITVVGSRCGPFGKAIDALREKSVCVTDLITHRVPLEQGPICLQKAQEKGVLKTLIEVSSAADELPAV